MQLHSPIRPMLLQSTERPPEGSEYIHQLKFDGHRCIISFIKGQETKLYTRHDNECTWQYPEMQIDLPVRNVILDAEMIVLENGKPDFESVMTRFQAKREMTIKRLQKELLAHLAVFDILYLNDKDLRNEPLENRLEILQSVIPDDNRLSIVQSFDNGVDLFEATKKLGLEGIVSKDKKSKYKLDHRTSSWLKVKNYQYETVQIAGIRKGEFGWLLLKDGKYVGVMEFAPLNVRTAFRNIAKQITIGEDKDYIRLDPLISCKVKFQCYTKSGLMRSPSFVEFVNIRQTS